MSLLSLPWLFPIRNPCELRGLYRRSYFGPRTCGRRINHFSSKCSGFLIRVSPSHPYWGRCNAIVPLHLPDALEYKFLGCIPEHHRLWMASSEIRMAVQILPLQCRQDRTRRGGWMAASRCVRCMQGVCCVFGFRDMDSCQDVLQYKVMKYLVFGTILSSLLSELQITIPKTDRNGVCIGMANPTL